MRVYQDEAGGVAILVDRDNFGDQVPVLLNFDDDGADIKSLSHLTKSVRVSLDKKVRIEWHDEYFEENANNGVHRGGTGLTVNYIQKRRATR